MENEPNEKHYGEEDLRDKTIRIYLRGDWKVLGFIEPQKEGQEKQVILKSLTIRNQRETIRFSKLIEQLTLNMAEIVN